MPALCRPSNTSPTVSPPVASRRYRRVLFDSNIWIASITKSDFFHYESLRLISSYTSRKFQIIIPIIVVIEIVAYISRNQFLPDFKNNYLKHLTLTENYQIVSLDSEQAMRIAQRLPQSLGLRAFDYFILIYCLHYAGIKLETFDQALKKAYNKTVNIEKR